MIKIEIHAEDGSEVKVSKGNFVYYKEPSGKDHYWEWSHFSGRDTDFEQIFEAARGLAASVRDILPEIPMSAMR